jgi:hypothetical protein
MERNSSSYFSVEYWKAVVIGIYTFFYMFVYSMFYTDIQPRRGQNNTNRNNLNRGGGQGPSYSFRGMGRG